MKNNRVLKVLLSAAVLLFAASTMHAATIFLKVTMADGSVRKFPINGETFQVQLENTMISGYSFSIVDSVDRAVRVIGSITVKTQRHANATEIVSPRDAASGLPTGKRMHKPFVITKELDKSSPAINFINFKIEEVGFDVFVNGHVKVFDGRH